MLRWFKRRANRQAQSEREAAAFPTQLAVAAEQRRAQRAAWLAALPSDLQADLSTMSDSELDSLMATAALTPPSDCANAVRRWRTMPDDAPRRPAGMPMAAFVDLLFTTQLRPDGTCYTEDDISIAFDGTVDPAAVQQLRAGAYEELDLELLFAVGRFFHVPPEYFVPGLLGIRRVGSALDPHNRCGSEELLRMVFNGEWAQQFRDTERAHWVTKPQP